MEIKNLTDSRIGCEITYTDDELAFMDTLTEKQRKNIFRGIAIPSDYGYKSNKSGVTLDEDEECEFEFVPCDECEEYYDFEKDYYVNLLKYAEFKKNFAHYLLHDNRADETTFKLWKAFAKDIEDATDIETKSDNKACQIAWLEQSWGAFLECILDGSYKYMNVAGLVLESWNRFCE